MTRQSCCRARSTFSSSRPSRWDRCTAMASCSGSSRSRRSACSSSRARCPALYRLEHQALITSEWGESENKRKAKYYRLTAAGRRRLKEETACWRRFSEAIGFALEARRRRMSLVGRVKSWFRSAAGVLTSSVRCRTRCGPT